MGRSKECKANHGCGDCCAAAGVVVRHKLREEVLQPPMPRRRGRLRVHHVFEVGKLLPMRGIGLGTLSVPYSALGCFSG